VGRIWEVSEGGLEVNGVFVVRGKSFLEQRLHEAATSRSVKRLST
jgi:hypothetical protein